MSVEQVSPEQGKNILTEFEFEGQRRAVIIREHVIEFPGVESDTYFFADDKTTSDVAIIRLEKGAMTPRQRIMGGDRTAEVYVEGKGWLVVERANGEVESYNYDGVELSAHPLVDVLRGDIMQLRADPESPLIMAEVCYPPYQDGRFQNLS